MKRPAVFFDRDNTLIAAHGFLGDPEKVALIDGAPEAVARVRSLGFAVVVFSNQSGVARGLFSEQDVHRVNARLDELLQDQDAHAVIDRHEFCPFHPEGTVAEYARESELRKPRPGMVLQAAEKLALDLPRSWVIGDAPRDIEAGKAAGCRTIWYKDPRLPPATAARELMLSVPDAIVGSLKEATDVIARDNLLRPSASRTTAPPATLQPTRTIPISGAPPETTTTLEQSEPEDRQMPSTEPLPEREIEPASEPAAEAGPEPASSHVSELRRGAGGPRSVASAKPLIQVLAQKRAATVGAGDKAQTGHTQPVLIATARLEELAEQILQELQRRDARDETEFSISKLLAGIVQIVAIAAPLLVYFLYHTPAEPALLLGIFLQALTIALLIMGRQR